MDEMNILSQFNNEMPEYLSSINECLFSREEVKRFQAEIKDYHFLSPIEYSFLVKGFQGDYTGFYKLKLYQQNILASDFYYSHYEMWSNIINENGYNPFTPIFKRMVKLLIYTDKEKTRMQDFIKNLDSMIIGKQFVIDMYSINISRIIEGAFSMDRYLAAFNFDSRYNELIEAIQEIIIEFKQRDETFFENGKCEIYEKTFDNIQKILKEYLEGNRNYKDYHYRFAYISKEYMDMVINGYELCCEIIDVMNAMDFKCIESMNKKQQDNYFGRKHELCSKINYVYILMMKKSASYLNKFESINNNILKPRSRYFTAIESSLRKISNYETYEKDMYKVSVAMEFLSLLEDLSDNCKYYIEYKDNQFSDKKEIDKKRSVREFRKYTIVEAINGFAKQSIMAAKVYIRLVSGLEEIEKNGPGCWD